MEKYKIKPEESKVFEASLIIEYFDATIKGLDFIKLLPDTEENIKIKDAVDKMPWHFPVLLEQSGREGSVLMLYTTDKDLSGKLYIMKPPYNKLGQYVVISYIGDLIARKIEERRIRDSHEADYTLYFPPQAREYEKVRILEILREPVEFSYSKDLPKDGLLKIRRLGD